MAISDYQNNAQASQHIELFEISIGQDIRYYTSYEKDYTFLSNLYRAIPIEQKGFSNDDKMQPIPLKLSLSLEEDAVRFIASSPIEPISLKVIYVLKSDPTEFETFYKGRVLSYELDEKGVSFNLESKTDIFRQKVPNVKHTSLCNNILFDSVCGLDENLFSDNITVSSISGATVVSSDFAAKPNGWYNRGKLRTSYGDVRMITAHSGNSVTIHIPFDSRVSSGSSLVAVAGCDRKRTTCEIKFSNLENNVSMPEIPSHNPAVWGVEGTR